MAAEVLLHVGMHKTGTTALQQALDGYDDGRIRMARLGHANHSVGFVTAFATQPHRYHVWQRVGASPERVAAEQVALTARIGAELALDRDRLLVVGEEISLLPSAAVGRMAAFLRARAGAVSVLAYLRDPAGYVTSAFQQQVRGGLACFTLPRPHYRGRFEKFAQVFGTALTFRAYRPDRFAEGSVIRDYEGVAGLPPGRLADTRANPALAFEALQLVHLLNRITPPSRSEAELAARSALIRLLGSRFTTRFTLPPAVAGGVIDPDELGWIADLSGITFGPQPDRVAPDKAEAALSQMFQAIAPETVDTLRDAMVRHGLPAPATDPADLMLALYRHILAAELSRSARALA